MDENKDNRLLLHAKKLLDNLFFNGLDVRYELNIRHNRDGVPYLDIYLDIDVERVWPTSEKYDARYSETMYGLEEDISNPLSTYLGLNNTGWHSPIGFAFDYYNTEFLDDSIAELNKQINKKLIYDENYSPEDVESWDVWTNVYYREDDSPWINLEVGTRNIDSIEDRVERETVKDKIKDIAYDLQSSIPHLNGFDDIEFWFEY
jgi:hypothetical protein